MKNMSIVMLILILFVLALTSCNTHPHLVGVQNRNDTLLLYTEKEVICVPLYDEHQTYFFKYQGNYHQVTYKCSGYSYGEHSKVEDYVLYGGTKYLIR